MGEYRPPLIPIVFRGINLAGNPARRPEFTACVARDIRIMGGEWIRLRGGRNAKKNTVGGTVLQIHSFRDPNFPGSNAHMAQIKYAGTGKVNWTWFDLATYTIDPFGIQEITQTYDTAYSYTNLAAATNVTDRPVFYNGLGVRDGTNSRPAFSSYFGGVVRFFGLDAYCPSGLPTASFTAGAGNNVVSYGIRIYVGLYHEPTGHYSNGVFAGTIGETGATGTITVSNLNRLSTAYNNATEQNELKYVFYASPDGYQQPYLIMNSAHTGPFTVAISSTSASLSIEAVGEQTENGFFLNTTVECPTDNFPPRPMRCVATVNQRMYGIPLNGGSGSGSDFTYVWGQRDYAQVVYSKAAGDGRRTKLVGDPTQCWPLENKKPTPNIEAPVWLAPSLSGDSLLVWTATSLFLMEPQNDGTHTFRDISRIHGLKNPSTVRVTSYGITWVDQRNAICMLQSDSQDGLVVISSAYQEVLRGKTPTCANYLLDPDNEIDWYQVWFSDGTTVINDFSMRDQDFPYGMAVTGTNQDFTAAATLVAVDGTRHFVVAKGGFYTHEVEPTTGLIPTTDQTFANTTDQTTVSTEINGEYRFNWNRIQDWNLRKKLAGVYFIGDGAVGDYLNAPAVAMKWWGDFQAVPGTPQTLTAVSVNQTATQWQFRFTPTAANRYFFKIGFTISGHSSDDSGFHNHRRPAEEGDLAKNFYGSILEAAYLIGEGGARP